MITLHDEATAREAMHTTTDYVIHLSLDDLLAAVMERRPSTCYLQTATLPQHSAGITVGDSFVCYLTAPVAERHTRTIHALRLHLEAVPRHGYESEQMSALDTAVRGRIDAISARLREELVACGTRCRNGIALVPGLREDLNHYTGSQSRWRIVQDDRRDPLTRRLEWI
jgi:hypothetical protein